MDWKDQINVNLDFWDSRCVIYFENARPALFSRIHGIIAAKGYLYCPLSARHLTLELQSQIHWIRYLLSPFFILMNWIDSFFCPLLCLFVFWFKTKVLYTERNKTIKKFIFLMFGILNHSFNILTSRADPEAEVLGLTPSITLFFSFLWLLE